MIKCLKKHLKDIKDKAEEFFINFWYVVVLCNISLLFLLLVVLTNKSKTEECEKFSDVDRTNKIMLLESPYGGLYQIIIPSNDGLMSMNIFVKKEDLIELKKIIENIENKSN